VIDFSKVEKGSDLWLWHQAVDFSDENVEVVATAKGAPVTVWYEIRGDRIIFHGDEPTDFSYRLTGRRHDWREHPTKVEE